MCRAVLCCAVLCCAVLCCAVVGCAPCRKKTLRLEAYPEDPTQLKLSFSFSATAPCRYVESDNTGAKPA
jgi:hypothetical protein